MAAETLNFGPEWLRALSSGGSMTSPPSSPAMPKYKLADYRYGREEMLALYIKENKVPEEMQDKEFAAIVQEEPLQPLALVPLTEEEQRNFSMSVNSVAVLRLMGKGGGPPPAGVSRGRGGTRGRGRGRGEGGYYQRSIEDGDGGFGRGSREIHRSQSWDDRGERRFEKPIRRDIGRGGFDEGSTASSRKEYARSDSDNWRTLREEHDEDDEGSWRVAGSRRENERWRSTSPEGARSAGWRDHNDRRRKFDFDFRERDEERGPRRNRSSSDNFEDDKDLLPEWCMDDEDEEMGTFDSSGAFLSLKKSPKEPIPEEQELDFKGVVEEEEVPEMKDENKECVEPSGAEKDGKDVLIHKMTDDSKLLEQRSCSPSSSCRSPANGTANVTNMESENLTRSIVESEPVLSASGRQEHAVAVEGDSDSLVPATQLSSGASNGHCSSPSPTACAAVGVAINASATNELPTGDIEDDDGMTHLQQEAEKMVASLQDNSLDEDQFSQAVQEQRNTAAALPLSHEAAMKWFYKDPQGEIQGPFSTQEMAEWFQAGYFSMALLVKRGCDEGFQPLGDVIKMWGRVPFAPGPSPPPLLGNMDQERLKKQQELAAAAFYQQLQQQQQQQLLQLLSSRQQYAQCTLQQKAATGDLTPQQVTTFMQQQQLQALKSRCGEQAPIPSMNRSMSVPDTASLWDMHTSASQQAGSEANCLWDLPINSSTQGPVLEQLQLQHKISPCPSWGQQPISGSASQNSFKACIQKVGEGRGREPRDECRQQQELLIKILQSQQAQQNSSTMWSSLSKQNSIKSLLELQQEGDRQLQKPRGPSRAHPAVAISTASMTSLPTQWGAESSSMWGSHDKNSATALWEDSLKNGPVMRSIGLKNSRSSPSLSDAYGITNRQNRKKTEEEEKLLKLLQGIKQQDGFTQWCEQMLHALNTSNTFDVPTFVSFLKDVDSPYDVHDYIRSYLGDTREAKEFAKQFLERRAKQKANQQRQQQQFSKELNLNMNFSIQPERLQDSPWVNHSSLQSVFQVNHTSKQQSYDSSQAGKLKKTTVLHADPSILGQRTSGSQLFDSFALNKLGAPLGYSLHSSPGEMETIDDY